MKKYIVSLIEEVVTPESSEIGEYESQEYVIESEEMDIFEVLQELKKNAWEVSRQNTLWLHSIDPDRDYASGSESYYSLFIENMSIEDLKKLKNSNDLYVCNF